MSLYAMGEVCEIVFEKEQYQPGESVNGDVYFNNTSPCTVRAIKITVSGRAKVYWKEGKTNHYHREPFFEMESNLLLCETAFEPGNFVYPFTFNLPQNIPSSMDETRGNIKYEARANIDIACGIDEGAKKILTVYTCDRLATLTGRNVPIECVKEKIPLSLGGDGPVRITVNLSQDCFAPNQMVPFVATVSNGSGTTVQEVRFKIEQGFKFHTSSQTREDVCMSSEGESAVLDSVIEPHNEKFWNLELRVPATMFIGTTANCHCINIFWRIKGEVVLPFPHTNMHIEVPLYLGSISE